MSEEESKKEGLRKIIGLPEAVAFGIGGMIGGGVFALSGSIAEESGYTAILVFAMAALIALCSALPYAEFSTIIVGSGGGYSYVNEVFPEFIGFVAGWWFFLAYSMAGAFYSVVFGIYMEILIGINYLVFSFILISLFMLINFLGAKESSVSEILLVAFKLIVIIMFVAGGLLTLNFTRAKIYFVTDPLTIINLTATVFIAFEGFDIVSILSKEAKEPTKTIPKAILISIVTVTALYILVELIELTAISSNLIPADASPEEIILYAAYNAFGNFGIYILTAAAIISTMSAYNATLYAVSRVGFAMGENRALHRKFRLLHPVYNTQYMSIIFSSLLIIGVVTFLSLVIDKALLSLTLGELASLAFAFSFALVDFSLIVHRNIHVDLTRKYSTPFYPYTPTIGILTTLTFGFIIAIKNIIIFLLFIFLTFIGSFSYLFLVKKAHSWQSMKNIVGSDIWKAKEALILKKYLTKIKYYVAIISYRCLMYTNYIYLSHFGHLEKK